MTSTKWVTSAPSDIHTLPEAHTTFPLTVTVDSWWPLVLSLVVGAALLLAWKRRRNAP